MDIIGDIADEYVQEAEINYSQQVEGIIEGGQMEGGIEGQMGGGHMGGMEGGQMGGMEGGDMGGMVEGYGGEGGREQLEELLEQGFITEEEVFFFFFF